MIPILAGRRPRPTVSWHRGGAELAPLGTLAGFQAAAWRAAELVEVDLRASNDSVLVCSHDREVGGLGPLDSLTWEEARRAGVPPTVFAFDELLDAIDEADPGRRTGIQLDVKVAGIAPKAVESVRERGRAVIATSAVEEVVAEVRREHRDVAALLIMGSREATGDLASVARRGLREAVALGRILSCGATGVAAHYYLAGPHLRAFCRWRGLGLLVWTVDSDRSLLRWVRRDDVDIVTTNRPLAALALRGPTE